MPFSDENMSPLGNLGLSNTGTGRDLFVGNLSFFCQEKQLRDLFSNFGEIHSIRIKRNDRGGRSLMYGFVCMTTPAAAANAAQTLNRQVFMGRNIRVEVSQGPDHMRTSAFMDFSSMYQLHLCITSNFDGGKIVFPTEELLRSVFEEFGDLVDITVKEYIVHKSRNRQEGYGFVTYSTEHAATAAAAKCAIVEVHGVRIEACLSFHNPKPKVSSQSGDTTTSSSSSPTPSLSSALETNTTASFSSSPSQSQSYFPPNMKQKHGFVPIESAAHQPMMMNGPPSAFSAMVPSMYPAIPVHAAGYPHNQPAGYYTPAMSQSNPVSYPYFPSQEPPQQMTYVTMPMSINAVPAMVSSNVGLMAPQSSSPPHVMSQPVLLVDQSSQQHYPQPHPHQQYHQHVHHPHLHHQPQQQHPPMHSAPMYDQQQPQPYPSYAYHPAGPPPTGVVAMGHYVPIHMQYSQHDQPAQFSHFNNASAAQFQQTRSDSSYAPQPRFHYK